MIDTDDDIARALLALQAADPRLARVVAVADALTLRRSEPGLRGLCATIVAQQVSRASADAIFRRLASLVDLTRAEGILAASDEDLRAAGLSRPKQRTLRAIAEAIAEGRLDFEQIAGLPAPEAIAQMTAVHGIGVWTAECHLLFAHGHEDVFPAGDLALQISVAHGLDLTERPKEKPLRAIAELWSPHRGVAARLFWSYYHAVTRRDAAPVEPPLDSQAVKGGGKPARAPRPRSAQGFTKATR